MQCGADGGGVIVAIVIMYIATLNDQRFGQLKCGASAQTGLYDNQIRRAARAGAKGLYGHAAEGTLKRCQNLMQAGGLLNNGQHAAGGCVAHTHFKPIGQRCGATARRVAAGVRSGGPFAAVEIGRVYECVILLALAHAFGQVAQIGGVDLCGNASLGRVAAG